MIEFYRFMIVDMDGTLIDQSERLHQCCVDALAKINEPPPALLAFRRAFGSFPEVVDARICPSGKVPAAIKCYEQILAVYATQGVELLPGCREYLTACRNKGTNLALLTNKPGPVARQILRDFGLHEFFKVVVGFGDTIWRKPQPEVMRFVLDRLKAVPGQTCVVGDSPVDVAAANRSK